jgi:PRTRC genetic system protein F
MNPHASACGRFAAFRLPSLGPTVPRCVVSRAATRRQAAIARFLVDAEAFDDEDVPVQWSDALRACEQAVQSRLRRAIGPLQCLRPGFGMDLLDAEGRVVRSVSGACRSDSAQACRALQVYWFECGEQEWPVGPGLEALKAACPGLGGAVLQVLRIRSHQVYPLFLPITACDVASYVYWCGEEDEEVALDMHCGEDEKERENMRSEMVTKPLLESSYPEWARSWRREPGGHLRKRLGRAMRSLTDPALRLVVRDALALDSLRWDKDFDPEVEGEYIGFGAVLSWREQDVTVRIHDDLLQMAHDGECTDRMGEHRIALDDPGAFGAWLRVMQARFEAISLIDRLIAQLAGGDWTQRAMP